ncbi:protein tyrosine phosphatase [Paenibacillus pasadenensis]|uniref:tyrosine-protein phosphatase n=1 Tax=Paenibacillus pasadenensis TaxID=217090 RepID=UPI002041B52A|nr:CpsB/CapC family capsule biosynthesis tyrosine phosphatase [Paenibacillus pasadenensis]MCM3747594.1 protein tyrosine phosphatase [Paenibacillus pasadenensis]
MIDIHTHILPGIDDGARHEEHLLELAAAAVQEGITDIIATPHHANGVYWNPGAEVTALLERSQQLLTERGFSLRLHAGQEIRVHAELLDNLESGELLTLAGTSYMLLEMPTEEIPAEMSELIYELTLLGIRPVIAHPERNMTALREPHLLEELIQAGAWTQVTTHSLLGLYGKTFEKGAWSMMRNGLIHLVSSDAHHPRRRGFRLAESYSLIASRMGGQARLYFEANAARLLSNEPLEPSGELLAQAQGAGTRGLLRGLFGRRGR